MVWLGYVRVVVGSPPLHAIEWKREHSGDTKGATMPDLELRFHRSMLTLSSPLDYVLERQGVDMQEDAEFMSLFEGDF
jgi:hypothetical protein